jgi:hypothetical protein
MLPNSMTARLVLLCVVLGLPLACMSQTMPLKGDPVKLSDFAIVAVHPRLLVVTLRCEPQDTFPGGSLIGVVRDQDGLPQSDGFALVSCEGRPQQVLFQIPDGTGELQHSVVQFTFKSPSAATAYTKTFSLPAQAAVALAPPTEMQKGFAAMRGPDPLYAAAFRNNFEVGDFAAVDRLFDRLDRDDVKLANGRSADETYWDALREKLSSPERTLWLQRFSKWLHDTPRSNAANIATALAIRYDAWTLRGTSTDSTLDPDARKLFIRRLAQAERLVSPHNQAESRSPLQDELLIEMLREGKKPAAQIEAAGAEAIARFPQHAELYVTLADPNTLFTRQFDQSRQPLQAVDWAHAEQLIRIARAASASQSSTYALFYIIMFSHQPIEFDPFSDSFANWHDMQISFEALIKSYPAAENLNRYAAYSCRARDWKTYQAIRSQLNSQLLQPDKWPANFQPQVCDAQAS